MHAPIGLQLDMSMTLYYWCHFDQKSAVIYAHILPNCIWYAWTLFFVVCTRSIARSSSCWVCLPATVYTRLPWAVRTRASSTHGRAGSETTVVLAWTVVDSRVPFNNTVLSTSSRWGCGRLRTRTGLNRRTLNSRQSTWTLVELQWAMTSGHGSSSRGIIWLTLDINGCVEALYYY